MSDPVHFLIAMSHALSTMGLYGDDHPATARALDNALERLRELQGTNAKLHFTFLTGEVLVGSEMVHELEGWEWSARLVKAGIERIEFTDTVEPEQFARFLSHLTIRLGIRSGSTSDDLWQMGESAIKFGQVALAEGFKKRISAPFKVASLTYTLRE